MLDENSIPVRLHGKVDIAHVLTSLVISNDGEHALHGVQVDSKGVEGHEEHWMIYAVAAVLVHAKRTHPDLSLPKFLREARRIAWAMLRQKK